MFEQLRGGSLLTGEGGDAVLGARRVTPLAALRHGRRPDRALVRYSALAALPRRARQRIARRMMRTSVQRRWLRPAAFERHVRLARRRRRGGAARYGAATWSITRLRSFATISHNHAAAAAEYGIRASDPLLDHRFVAALARAGGRTGYLGRTATMHALFSDVLPPAVLGRTTKASFNHAHAGAATREFARTWDGSGVDEELVDVERLRSVWLSDEPTMATGVLLHSAWLASVGLRAMSRRRMRIPRVRLAEVPDLCAALVVAVVVEVGLRTTTLPRLARALGTPLAVDGFDAYADAGRRRPPPRLGRPSHGRRPARPAALAVRRHLPAPGAGVRLAAATPAARAPARRRQGGR